MSAPADQRLGDVAGVLQTAVGDHRDAGRPRREVRLVDRAHLRDSDPGDDPGGADGARPDADLDRVGAGVDQGLRTGAGGDVAADDLDAAVAPEVGLDPRDHVEHRALVAVRGVDDDHVDPGVDQQAGALVRVLAHAQGGTDDQPAAVVLGGQGVLVALDEVLDRDEPAQPAGLVDQRQLLDLVLGEQRQRGVGVHADGRGDQRHRRHHVADESVLVGLEAHVPVGDDAEEDAVGVDDRCARDAVAGRQRVDLGEGVVRRDGDGVGHHAGLGPLHQVDLAGLLLGGQVAVQHAHAADAGHGDGHARLGDGVHRAGQQGYRQPDPPRHPAARVDLCRDDVGLPRDEQDVVVGQPQGGELGR